MAIPEELVQRAGNYAQRHGLVLGTSLGAGVQGSVFVAESPHQLADVRSAIKAHQRRPDYARERDVYRRLKQFDVTEVRGCHVPRLLGFDDELWVIDMTVVSQPFVLDFGGAYLDRAPDFSDEVMAECRAEKEEQFGPRWPEAQAIVWEFEEEYGVILQDVNPRNIQFGD
jgi:hypothetical protein